MISLVLFLLNTRFEDIKLEQKIPGFFESSGNTHEE